MDEEDDYGFSFGLDWDNMLFSSPAASNNYDYRSAITLKNDTKIVSGGNGTINNLYVVQ